MRTGGARMTTETHPRLMYSLIAAASVTDSSRDYLLEQIHAGHLRAKKVGRAYRIPADALQEWIDQLPDAV